MSTSLIATEGKNPHKESSEKDWRLELLQIPGWNDELAVADGFYSLEPRFHRVGSFRVTPQEGGRLFRALGWASYGVIAGDLVTTEIVLRDPAGYEANPFVKNRAVRVGSHVAFALLWNHVSESFYAHGRKRAALWMRIASVVGYGLISARNIHVARGH